MNRETHVPEEAAAWVDRLNQPAMDAAAGPDFDAWMTAEQDHREAFADIQALWHSNMFVRALQQAESAAAPAAPPATLRDRFGRLRGAAPGMAAATCAALLAAFLISPSISFDTYRTGLGNGRSVVLADGSRVDLSGDAELRVLILPWSRTATLVRGEAYFDVHHEPDRTFSVSSGSTSVHVLGTAFNVDRQSPTRTAVEVYRGAVRIETDGKKAAAHESVILRKGDRARVDNDHIAAQPHYAPAVPDWKSGWFEASNVPLGTLIDKTQRYSRLPIIVPDAALRDLPISGRFQVSDTARVLAAVSEAYQVDIAYGREAIKVSRTGRKN